MSVRPVDLPVPCKRENPSKIPAVMMASQGYREAQGHEMLPAYAAF